MDCEKFEPLLLDELYEELDELTSAALKRHVSGCARCKSALDGMRATRRLVSLPMVELPEGLEERIFAAAKEAQKVVPIKSRLSRALSVAGSWAMRPQTAMAAVFLLMIGSSAFLFSNKLVSSRAAPEAVSVTVAGSPQDVAPASESDRLDDKSAAAAHGPIHPPPVATAAPAASIGSLLAENDNDSMGRLEGAARDKAKDERSALGAFGTGSGATGEEASKGSHASRSAGPGYEPSNAAAPAGAPYGTADSVSQQAQPLAKRAAPGGAAQDPFSLGTAAYRARNFAEATRQFDAAAKTGDQNAALWAARSSKEGQGCATALGRFDSVAQKAAGTWHGSEASLEAARCQIAMGQLDPAREKLNRLVLVASHAAPAKQALVELDAVAARRAGHVSGGAHAAPKAQAAPAPARAPAKPATVDTANGF